VQEKDMLVHYTVAAVPSINQLMSVTLRTNLADVLTVEVSLG